MALRTVKINLYIWVMRTRENSLYLGDGDQGEQPIFGWWWPRRTAYIWVMGTRENSLYLGDGNQGEQPVFGWWGPGRTAYIWVMVTRENSLYLGDGEDNTYSSGHKLWWYILQRNSPHDGTMGCVVHILQSAIMYELSRDYVQIITWSYRDYHVIMYELSRDHVLSRDNIMTFTWSCTDYHVIK